MKEKAIRQINQLKKVSNQMRLAAEGWDKQWKTLIATIMSARTRDETTLKVAEILFQKYKTLVELSKAQLDDIQNIIKPINFYKNKSKNILNCARVLAEKYKNQVPLDFKKLIELPGVGRKTANVFLSEYGCDAAPVDTHVSYISQKLNWTKNKNPSKIEEDLKKLFPKEYWSKINPILVRFGKTFTSRKKKNEILEKIRLTK